MKYLLLFLIVLCGCNVSPFSPRFRQPIGDNSEIDEIKNNQNGVLVELGKLRQSQELTARDVKSIQTNSGIQIGDGLILGLLVGWIVTLYFVWHWWRLARKSQKIIRQLRQ